MNQMKGLRRTFYVCKISEKDEEDIEMAEQLTCEGDKIWESLRQEYMSTYLNDSDTSIQEQGISTLRILIITQVLGWDLDLRFYLNTE